LNLNGVYPNQLSQAADFPSFNRYLTSH